jgi:hypothetical protein
MQATSSADGLAEAVRTAAALRGAFAALGGVLVLWATAPWGSGLDFDSVEYVSAAQSLCDGEGWLQCDGKPFAAWPPLMPMWLALGRSLGASFDSTTRALHAAAVFATVWLASGLAGRVTGSARLSIAVAAALALSPAAHVQAALGLSETIFVALVVGALGAAREQSIAPRAGAFALCVVLSALACLQRYVGVALVASIAVQLAAFGAPRFARRLRAALAYGVLSVLPLAAWCARNVALTGHASGPRGNLEGDSWAEIGAQLQGTLASWFWPGAALEGPLRTLIVGSLLAAAALVVVRRAPRRDALLSLLFPVLYVGLNAFSSRRIDLDDLGDRQLLPIAPSLWLLLALGLSRVGRRWVWWSAAALFAGHVVFAASLLSKHVAATRREGPGVYTARAWREAEFALLVANLAREGQLEGPLESNDRHGVFVLTRLRALSTPPRAAGFRARLEREPARRKTVVWFEYNERARFPVEAVESAYDVHVVARASGGSILRLEPRM